MDYLKIYNHFYNKTVYNTKCLILNYYKNSKNKKRPVTIVNNTVLKKLYDYRTEKYSNKLLKEFSAPFDVFQNRHMYYEGSEQDRIKWVLEEEVLHAFGSKNKSDYFSFIADLAVEQALAEISRHFRNYYSYYELVYDLERYDYLCLKDFEGGSFENSIEYNDMVNVKYPDRDKNSATPEFAIEDKIDTNSKGFMKKEKHSNKFELDVLERINLFTDDERFLLINVFVKMITDEITYSDTTQPKMTTTVFMKIMKIAGSFNDVSIFSQKSTNNTSYSKVSKGIDYYSSKENIIKNIDSVIMKLDGFGLEIFIDELQRIKRNYILNTNRKQ